MALFAALALIGTGIVAGVAYWASRGTDTVDASDSAREELLQHLASKRMDGYQAGLLADGELSDEEYREAFTRLGECIDDGGAGFLEGTAALQTDGLYWPGFDVPLSEDDGFDRVAWSAVWDCRRMYFEVVQQWRVVERLPLPPGAPATGEAADGRQWLLNYVADGPMSEFERELLEDGALTENEYDQAFARFRECATAAGGEMSALKQDARGLYPGGVSIPPLSAGVANRAARAEVEQCRKSYFDVVQQWRSIERGASRTETELFREAIVVCLRQRGLEPGSVEDLEARLAATSPDTHQEQAAEQAAFTFAVTFCSLDLGPLHGQPPGSAPFRVGG